MAETTPLHFRSAADLLRSLERREISARELLEHFVARVEHHDPKLNAVVAMDLDGARARALAADEARRHGRQLGRLHGLPMTIKDAFEVAGFPSTGGSPELAGHVPQRSAAAVERIEGAGAVIFGKTNVPFLSADIQTFNAVYGTTHNPWDQSRGPGGSSGGAAAAVAAGLTGLELGSDIGGSIRTPAHLCGVFGHKPTFGIVPKRGHIPPQPGARAEADLSVVGPIGRSAEDLLLLLEIIVGPEGRAAAGWRLALPPPRARSPKDLRVAVWIDDPHCDIDRESAELLQAAACALEAAGAHTDWKARPGFTLEESSEIYLTLLHAGVAARFPESVRSRWRELAQRLPLEDRSHAALQARGGTISHAGWLEANERRHELQAKWDAFFRDCDVVLAPTLMCPAFLHDQRPDFHQRRLTVNGVEREYLDLLLWAGPAIVAYLPASVAPVGLTRAGLPVGIQIIGPHLEDQTTIAVAAMLEEILGGFRPPPGF